MGFACVESYNLISQPALFVKVLALFRVSGMRTIVDAEGVNAKAPRVQRGLRGIATKRHKIVALVYAFGLVS